MTSRVAPLQTALNAGEFSEQMEGRSTDFQKYRHAMRKARNLLLSTTGAAYTRPGTRYVREIKLSSVKGRLWPFLASADIDDTEVYMLEWGDNALRIIKYHAALLAEDITSSITNGAFPSGITDWDDLSASPAAISHDAVNDRLSLDPSGDDFAHAEQDVTTSDTGTQHLLRFKTEGVIGAKVKVQIGDGTGESDILSPIELGLGYHVVAFTPAASPYYVQFINEMDNDESVYVDDVEILDNVPLELVTPYAEADLYDMRFDQSNDVLYITMADGSIKPWQLERRGDYTWSLVETHFEDGPWLSINPSRRLSEDNLVPDGYFEEGIEKWTLQGTDTQEYDGEGRQLVLTRRNQQPESRHDSITTTAPNVEHVVHVNLTGGATNTAAGQMKFELGSTAGASDYLNKPGLMAGWYSWSFTPGAAFHPSFHGTDESTAPVGMATFLVYNTLHNLLEVDGTSGSVTLTALGNFEPFVSTDVGRSIRLEWPGKEAGWGVISAYTDSQTVTVQTRRDFAYADVPTESWRFGIWSDTDGWPIASTQFESRTVWDGGPGHPLHVCFSQSADLLNMRPDTYESAILAPQDDDGLVYVIASSSLSNINWLFGDSQLILGTAGGQWIMRSDGITITSTDVDAKQQTQIRASNLQPISIGDTGVYIEAGKRRVYDIGYSIEADQFVAADITVLAEHMFRRDRYAMQPAYQQRPSKDIWFTRSDGLLPVLKYDRGEGIVGWSLHVLGGSFSTGDPVVDCVAVKPGSDDSGNGQEIDSGERDEVWMIVKRTIDGNTVRYIEVLEGTFEGALRKDYSTEALWAAQMVSDQEDAFHIDCGITITQASSTAVSGLDHLEGEAVMVLNNGVVEGPHTVASGAITMDNAGTKLQIGLAYTWELESGSFPFGARTGASVGNPSNFEELAILFRASGGTISVKTSKYDENGWSLSAGENINWSHPQSSSKTPLWTGIKTVDMEGSWEDDQAIYLSGSSPLPVEILSLAPVKVASERKGGR